MNTATFVCPQAGCFRPNVAYSADAVSLVLDIVIKLGIHTVRVQSWNGLALPCRYPTESQISGSYLALSAAKREGHPKLQRPREEVTYG